VTPLLSYVTEC